MNPLQPASDFRKKWKLEIELDLGTFWNHRQDDAAPRFRRYIGPR